jgi:hypothetical protein
VYVDERLMLREPPSYVNSTLCKENSRRQVNISRCCVKIVVPGTLVLSFDGNDLARSNVAVVAVVPPLTDKATTLQSFLIDSRRSVTIVLLHLYEGASRLTEKRQSGPQGEVRGSMLPVCHDSKLSLVTAGIGPLLTT